MDFGIRQLLFRFILLLATLPHNLPKFGGSRLPLLPVPCRYIKAILPAVTRFYPVRNGHFYI
jgi:hypothetical protein